MDSPDYATFAQIIATLLVAVAVESSSWLVTETRAATPREQTAFKRMIFLGRLFAVPLILLAGTALLMDLLQLAPTLRNSDTSETLIDFNLFTIFAIIGVTGAGVTTQLLEVWMRLQHEQTELQAEEDALAADGPDPN